MSQPQPSNPSDSLPKEMHDRQDFPVFLMGSERSGTSTVAWMMKSVFGYEGRAEGHVFNLLNRMLDDVQSHYIQNGLTEVTDPSACRWNAVTLAQCIGRERLEQGLFELFREETGRVLRGRWFDKTPGPDFIAAAPRLAHMYPEARFIFIIREPLSQISSIIRRFHVNFAEACDRWCRSAETWLRIKHKLAPDRYLELRTEDLAGDASVVTDRVRALIAPHWDPLELVRIRTPATLPIVERTSPDDPLADLPLDRAGLHDAERELFEARCVPIAREFGLYGRHSDVVGPCELRLPCPYGQRGLEIFHGGDGGVWPQLHAGEMWIFMHPSTGLTPTTLTYRDLDLAGGVRLHSAAESLSQDAPPLRYSILLLEDEGGEELARFDTEVLPGGRSTLRVDLPRLPARCSLKLVAESITGSNRNAWLIVQPPRIERLRGP